MPLKVTSDEVPEGANVLQTRGGAMSTKMVYGNDCNLMLAVRGAGYHSNPHRHDAEQLNYVLEGEIWPDERTPEGPPAGAAFDVVSQAPIASDDVGVPEDSQHSCHH